MRGQGGVQRGRPGLGRAARSRTGAGGRCVGHQRVLPGRVGWQAGVHTAGVFALSRSEPPRVVHPCPRRLPAPPARTGSGPTPRSCSHPRTRGPGPGRADRRPSWSTARGGWPTGCAVPSARAAGSRNVVARSDDGVRFTPVVEIGKDALRRRVAGAARPGAHRPTAGGGSTSAARRRARSTGAWTCWRPTPWRASRTATPRTVLPGERRRRGEGPGDPPRRASGGTCGPRCTRSTTPTPPTG